MKLKTKLLTAISSIAIVSTVVPTTVSCGCSKKDYLFNYADHVNCRDKDDRNYHKPKEVKNAAKIRAPRAERGELNPLQIYVIVNLNDPNQFYFFDLIASIVLQNDQDINLKDWNVNETDGFSFNLNGISYPKSSDLPSSFNYVQNPNDETDKTIYLFYGINSIPTPDPNGFMFKSYAFSDCQWAEQGE